MFSRALAVSALIVVLTSSAGCTTGPDAEVAAEWATAFAESRPSGGAVFASTFTSADESSGAVADFSPAIDLDGATFWCTGGRALTVQIRFDDDASFAGAGMTIPCDEEPHRMDLREGGAPISVSHALVTATDGPVTSAYVEIDAAD